MKLQCLPLAMTTDNLRHIITTFRALKPAPAISITSNRVWVMDPTGVVVFAAKRNGQMWSASTKSGLVNAKFA